jgi:hypothetical protein
MAILFASVHGLISFSDGDRLLPSPRPAALSRYLDEATQEVRDCVRRAEFVGRWFAAAGTPTTVMALWGVTP